MCYHSEILPTYVRLIELLSMTGNKILSGSWTTMGSWFESNQRHGCVLEQETLSDAQYWVNLVNVPP